MILVSRQPVAVLASPSSSAPTMYGFPAGRPFRVIGHDGGFAHIQDLKSSASGWIEEAALAPPPRVPGASTPTQTEPFAVRRNPTNPSAGPKPKATKNDSGVTADFEAATQPDRRNSMTGVCDGGSRMPSGPRRECQALFSGGPNRSAGKGASFSRSDSTFNNLPHRVR